jgi:hypothetical protein
MPMSLFYYSCLYRNFHNQEQVSLVDMSDVSDSVQFEDKAFLDAVFAEWETDVDDIIVEKLMSLVK